MAYTIMEIWLYIFWDFGAKTCRFSRENMAKIGPLKIRTVLCSKLCQMLVFDEKKPFVVFCCISSCHELKLAKNRVVLLLRKLCDINLSDLGIMNQPL